ncbi:alpha/beta hydrolase [Winogradskyella sp.]|uniref:alpha/beta hydrolase n=1 Tax=Winogradskyella sp. TaxID=1883156 RepID=UPI00260394E3|nr:alpha/beta hydrolase [Winogradskyella sp.]
MKTKKIITLIVLFVAINCFSQEKQYPAPGKLVDIGGYNIHLIVQGEDTSGPTVVFFHGAGDIALIWNLVLPKVGSFATAVAIDHAGEGWSDHGYGMSLDQQVFDSHQALKMAGLKPPYIVVGHSLGGILANLFASEYKDDVSGVVLVDATHPDIVLKIYNKSAKKMEWKKMRLTANDTIPEVKKTPLSSIPEVKSFQPKRDFGDMLNKFSESDKKLFHWIYNERPWTYVKGQGNTYEAEIFQRMYSNYDNYNLGDIPLIVISADNKDNPEGDDNWSTDELIEHSQNLQKLLLGLSSNSTHIVASNSGHYIHVDEPDVIVDAIKILLKEK